MREGLRSGAFLAKLDNDEDDLEKGDDEINCHDLGNEENGLESDVEERAALILSDLNVDEVSMGSSPGKSMEGSVEGDKNGSTERRGRKRSRRDDNECDVGDCVEGKKVKEDTVDGSGSNGFKRKEANDEFLDGNFVVVLGRVLRSRSAAMGGKEKEINGNEVRDGLERSASAKEVQIRDRGNDQSENKVVRIDESESKESVGQGNKKLKRKRGRPPKIHEISGASKAMGDEEEVASVGQGKKKLKRKRGRPPKIQEKSGASKAMGDEEEVASVGQGKQKLKRKRGRPPKIQEKSGASDAMSDEEEKVSGFNKRRRGSKLVDSVNHEPMEISCLGKEFIPKELNSKRISSAKENKSGGPGTQNKETSARVRSEQLGAFSPKTKNKKMKIKGNKTKECNVIPTKQQLTEKHLIRQRVTDLLLRCGWTIDYRPRRGREYNDAVYMSPDGRGYWSVTLAYKVLKKQAEEADGDSKHSSTSSAFIPIPEDDINKLTRITKKKMERELKLKKKTGGAIESDEVITDKKSTKKHCNAENSSSVSHRDKQNSDIKLKSKLSKGRKKGKLLHQEQAISNGTPSRGMKISVRTCKSQKTDIRARCALLVRNSKDGQNSESDDYALYPWKRSVLTWMIDLETLPLNGKVLSMNRRKTQVKLEGRIVRDGIQCGCCDKIFTISMFDAHSGSKLFQPLQNIYLESGTSLLECQLDSWNKQKESERNGFHYIDVDGDDPNDDTCGICGDGGDLICCDSCPSTFHQSCLDIQKFPSGDWHCVYCLCKLCGMVDGNMNQKDDCHTVTCSELFTCHLCEEKYHHSCSQAQVPGADDSIASSFCGDKCGELFERLEMLLGIKHQLEEGFSWTLIKRSDVASDLLLSGMPHKIESNSKLAVALAVMDECFLPVIDHRSGINVIHNILYNCGSNFNRLNYSGFFTAILERGDEIISAASIRIHGNQLAEMPFIGTRHMYRRQGMCSRLLSAIESALRSLNVEKLVIPAISELSQTWTSVFGFKPLEVSKRKEMRNLNMLVFPGTDLLQKPLLEHQSSVENGRPAADLKSADLGKENQTGISPLPANDTREGNEPYSTKEINENQKAGPTSTISTPDRTAVEQKSEQNHCGSCVESESLILSHNESMVSTETVSCEVKRGIVKNDASHDERSIYCADDAVTELQNVVEPPSQASCENTDCHNSEASNHIPHNGNGHESPQLKVRGFGLDADDKVIASQVINPTFLSDDQEAQAVVNDSVVALADECDLNPYSQIGNLNNCERAEPAPAKANRLLPYEASNGTAEPDLHTSVLPCSDGVNHHMAQEVCTDDVHDPKVGPIASQTSSSFAGDFLPDGNQRVTRSSKHSLSDSQVDHTSTAQCNSASLCNSASAPGVALLCAPGACNACGNPEVIILSNQAG